jgi:anti-sigma factor RsiW
MKPITAEELSAYLDGELDQAELAELERRLADSPEAREELEQLSGVVGKVRSLERLAPPDELQHRIQRVIDLEHGATGLRGRLAKRRARYLRLPSIIWTLLATILALAAMSALVAGVLQKRSEPDVIFVQDEPESDGIASQKAGARESAPAARQAIDGVVYELVERVWLPQGVGGEAVDGARRVAADSAVGIEMLPFEDPRRGLLVEGYGLGVLVEGEWVVVVLGGEDVEDVGGVEG